MSPKEKERNADVIAFIEDLMVTTKIERACSSLGLRSQFYDFQEIVGAQQTFQISNRPGEPLYGPEADLFDLVTRLQPALMIFDLGYANIPWRNWIPVLKSSPATRRIPMLCFGPHIDTEDLDMARELGAEMAVPRSRFMSRMTTLIEGQLRSSHREAIDLDCNLPISDEGIIGLKKFNEAQYYACHEHLENAWNEESSADRNVYKAVLQVAVAYYQIERQNYAGAVKMFLRARQWLASLPEICRGIDIGRLREDADIAHRRLVELGPEGIGRFEKSLFRPVRFDMVD